MTELLETFGVTNEPVDLESLAADIPEELRAIADFSMRLVDLQVTNGAPTCVAGRTEDGRPLTLYTREIPQPGAYRFPRRFILAAHGKDEDGRYLNASDWLVDFRRSKIRFREDQYRATGDYWELPPKGVPIINFDSVTQVVKIGATKKYEYDLPGGLEPAKTAISGLFLARTARLLGSAGKLALPQIIEH